MSAWAQQHVCIWVTVWPCFLLWLFTSSSVCLPHCRFQASSWCVWTVRLNTTAERRNSEDVHARWACLPRRVSVSINNLVGLLSHADVIVSKCHLCVNLRDDYDPLSELLLFCSPSDWWNKKAQKITEPLTSLPPLTDKQLLEAYRWNYIYGAEWGGGGLGSDFIHEGLKVWEWKRSAVSSTSDPESFTWRTRASLCISACLCLFLVCWQLWCILDLLFVFLLVFITSVSVELILLCLCSLSLSQFCCGICESCPGQCEHLSHFFNLTHSCGFSSSSYVFFHF